MENPALAQQLKVLLLCAFGLLCAALIGWNIGMENYYPLLLIGVVVVGIYIALLSSRQFWILTVASSFMAGTFPVLGGQFTPFQVLMAIGVARFFVADVILRRTKINFGSRFDVLTIFGFMGVLTLHAIQDRFGMRFLGSNVWGGRNYVNVYVGVAAFFVVRNVRIRTRDWANLPYAILGVVAFDAVIAIITTVFPSTIYKIYPFYSAVSIAGIEEIVRGGAVETPRLTSIGNFGVALMVFVLAKTSMRNILHPSNIFRLFGMMIAALAAMLSSFRSAVFSTLIVVTSASIRDLKLGVLALLPVIAAGLLALSIINSEVIPLPKQVQRSLAFLPGKWDTEMTFSSEASNDFRRRIWEVWQRQYFPVHPWIGRGFGFKSAWAKEATGTQQNNPNWDLEAVEIGNIHSGFFSTVDALGIVGAFFFVIWNIRLLAATFRVSFKQAHPSGFVLRFLALYLGTSIIFYWFGASSVGSFLPQEFALAAVFLWLQETIEAESAEVADRTAPLPHGEQAEPVLA